MWTGRRRATPRLPTSWDDLAVTRADAAQAELRGFEVPAPQTAGAWLRRFTLGHIRQLGKALLRTQRNAYVTAGVERVTLDFDSTYVFSRSRRRHNCAVRPKADTDSGGIRTPVPVGSGHSFRLNPDT